MAFLGMRGTGDWATNESPEDWAQMIMRLFPNGKAPLTAILSMMKKSNASDPKFHWWGKNFDIRAGSVTEIYADAGMLNTYDYATEGATHGIPDATIYLKVDLALCRIIRIGHVVAIHYTGEHEVICRGVVTNRVENGANSQVAVKLLEYDPENPLGAGTTAGLEQADYVRVIGNSNPEGGEIPDALARDPEEYWNYTQIFWDPLDITGTAEQTQLRTGSPYQEQKKDCLEEHSVGIENALLFGVRALTVGTNGKPQRTTGGLYWWTTQYGSSYNYLTDNGGAWTTVGNGDLWWSTLLEVAFRYGSEERVCLCGSGALVALNRLAETQGTINLTPTSTTYGLAIRTWIHPVGKVHLITHPIMSASPHYRYDCFIFDPKQIKGRPLRNRDTKFLKDRVEQSDHNMLDARKEGFRTELGLQVNHPETLVYASKLGIETQ